MAESIRRRAFAALAAALALAGCGVRDSAPPASEVSNAPTPAPPPAPAPPGPAVPPIERLGGDWVLVTIDGDERDRNAHYVHMRFEPGRIVANSQCIPFRWRYRDDGGRLAIESERYDGPICMRPLSFWERRFQEAMNAATRIEIAADGMLVVTGTGATLRLQRE